MFYLFQFLAFLTCCSLLEGTEEFLASLNTLEVKQCYNTQATTFHIESQSTKIGSIQNKYLSVPLEYVFLDPFDHIQANAKARFLSLGTIFDLKDSENFPIGTVEEKKFYFFPSFDLISPDQELLATATLNFWGTLYVVKNPEGKIIAEMSRPFFRIHNEWKIEFTNSYQRESEIDWRMAILLLAYQDEREKKRTRYGKFSFPLSEPNEIVFTERLNNHKRFLTDVEPLEVDYQLMEKRICSAIDPFFLEDKGNFDDFLDYFFLQLDSHSLTEKQKKALLNIFEKRLGDLTSLEF